jgi:SAM-dependent methyltransferase
MFDIITKQDYWTWLEKGYAPFSGARSSTPTSKGFFNKVNSRIQSVSLPPHPYELKDVQDAFILSRLQKAEGKRILEVGGGNPRVLRQFCNHNECWLVDKYEGVGRGPKSLPQMHNIKVVQGYMGEFLEQVPAGYFDTIFSVSVVEHIGLDHLNDFFTDCARVLKPSGRMMHAIDTYVFDPSREDLNVPFRDRIKAYLEYSDRPDLGIKLVEAARINDNLTFSCSYATLPDNVIYEWYLNRRDEKRVHGQVVSIKSEWEKIK